MRKATSILTRGVLVGVKSLIDLNPIKGSRKNKLALLGLKGGIETGVLITRKFAPPTPLAPEKVCFKDIQLWVSVDGCRVNFLAVRATVQTC